MARQGEAQHDGKGGGEFLGDAWKLRGAGGGAGAVLHGGGAALSVGGGETEKRAGGRRKRISLQFQKIPGT